MVVTWPAGVKVTGRKMSTDVKGSGPPRRQLSARGRQGGEKERYGVAREASPRGLASSVGGTHKVGCYGDIKVCEPRGEALKGGCHGSEDRPSKATRRAADPLILPGARDGERPDQWAGWRDTTAKDGGSDWELWRSLDLGGTWVVAGRLRPRGLRLLCLLSCRWIEVEANGGLAIDVSQSGSLARRAAAEERRSVECAGRASKVRLNYGKGSWRRQGRFDRWDNGGRGRQGRMADGRRMDGGWTRREDGWRRSKDGGGGCAR